MSYCSEVASGELQDIEFSKSCRQDIEFSKSCQQDLEFSKSCRLDLEFSKSCRPDIEFSKSSLCTAAPHLKKIGEGRLYTGYPNLAGKIFNFPILPQDLEFSNLAGKILNFPHPAG